MRDGSDDARTVPSGPMISASPAPDRATARSTSGASTLAAPGSAYLSRTTGVDAMFSATAIIRAPRTSRNSRVDCATDTAATAISTIATTSN